MRKLRGRNAGWSGIWPWPGNCKCGCFLRRCRSRLIWSWLRSLFRRERSAEIIPYSLSRLGIVIGDVSGKGAPAAIYAALVSGILRSHAPIEPGPAEMLSAVNLSLAERRIEAQFVSLIYAVWNDESRTLTVANSGLPRPIYVHAKDEVIEAVEATGLPLGLFDEAEYDEFKFRMKPGDMFVFFSDGILDARNRKG